MQIDIAGPDDLTHLARVLWLHAAPHEQARQSVESFAADLGVWWTAHQESHVCFVAREGEVQVVGTAWLARLVRAAADHAVRLGANHVTVHSSPRAVPLYERLGFASSPQLLERRS